jgi:amino acid transporter
MRSRAHFQAFIGTTLVEQPSNSTGSQPRRVLSLFDSVCIIVGTIIGSGIFATAPFIARNTNSFGLLIAIWIVGGLLALVGALCFAELMSTNQDVVGGDYVYLKKAYGRPVAFMFAWAAFWIIRPGNIGAMAMIFAEYFRKIFSLGSWDLVIYALGAVVLLSMTNLAGLRFGKGAQNLLTTAKVIGILAIVLLTLLRPAKDLDLPSGPTTMASLWVAMVLVMFTYGGWNDISFVTGEIRDPKKNLFRSLVLGTLTVTAIYVAVNIAYVVGLGYQNMASSTAVATDLARQTLGEDSTLGQRSSQLIALLVCISCLGAINAMILTSPRVYYAVGRDVRPLKFLSRWSQQRDVPWEAIVLQTVVTMGLILICLKYQNAFEVIVIVTAPYFWAFLGLTILALIVLRVRTGFQPSEDDRQAGVFRVPLYPLPPILFAGICFGLLYNTINYLFSRGYGIPFAAVSGVMAVGILLSLLFSAKKYQADPNEPGNR